MEYLAGHHCPVASVTLSEPSWVRRHCGAPAPGEVWGHHLGHRGGWPVCRPRGDDRLVLVVKPALIQDRFWGGEPDGKLP